MQFTLAMKTGRLTEAALTSLAAGAVVGLIAPDKKWAPWVVGLIILGMFLPVHVSLWSTFPVWYHLAFCFLWRPWSRSAPRLCAAGTRIEPRRAIS